MAPPLPLAHVAGPLALSFTAGRAALLSEPTPEASAAVPAPPSLPPVPGETDETTEPPPSETTAAPAMSPETSSPPVSTPAPGPVAPFEASYDDEDPLHGPRPSRHDEAIELLRPNTKQYMFSLFVGGSRALRGSYSYLNNSDFKIEAALGGFGRKYRVGGFGVVQVTAGFPLNTFTLAPRLSFNRQLVPNHAFYLNTNVTVGYRATTYAGYGIVQSLAGYAYHGAVVGVSTGVSAVVGERLLLSFRPLELELVAPMPSPTVQLNWAAMVGVGVLWGPDRD